MPATVVAPTPIPTPVMFFNPNTLPLYLSTSELSQLTGLKIETFEKLRYLTRKTGIQQGPEWKTLLNGTVRYDYHAVNNWLAKKYPEGEER
jgi:hypothetical protein